MGAYMVLIIDSIKGETMKRHIHDFEKLKTFAEPCESTLFSSYIDVNGDFYPCSFAENTKGWETGISV